MYCTLIIIHIHQRNGVKLKSVSAKYKFKEEVLSAFTQFTRSQKFGLNSHNLFLFMIESCCRRSYYTIKNNIHVK